tara:strand:- start:449 stop:973 length:525 start_codon:yes stop_codon:yes gene_type:complete
MNFKQPIILFLFILTSFTIAESNWKDNFVFERTTSFGLMSEKLGTDFWNLSSTIYRKNNNEIFISIGPSIAIPSNGGIGWKHYFKNRGQKGNIIPFSCLSMFSRSSNKMTNTSGDSIREDDCIGISGGISYFLPKHQKRNTRINAGVFLSYDFRNKPLILPVINIEFKKKNKEK